MRRDGRTGGRRRLWKEGRGHEEEWPSLCPLSPQLALTGLGVNSALLPVHLQAKAVHHAAGQQPIDGQLQQQGQQGLGPGCRARRSWVGREQGWRVYGQGAGAELEQGHLRGAGRQQG